MPIYIIEHLEPKLWLWCLIEYKHMSRILGIKNNSSRILEHHQDLRSLDRIKKNLEVSRIVGKNNLWFTNINKKDKKKLEKYGKVFSQSIKTMKLANACVLDPNGKKQLSPKESKSFEYFIFGGILGDNPPRARTKIELTKFVKNAKVRNIGKSQLSTDNAVFVVHEIARGKKIEQIPFQDGVEIRINKIESTILPYRYPLVKGKTNIPRELVEYLKKH